MSNRVFELVKCSMLSDLIHLAGQHGFTDKEILDSVKFFLKNKKECFAIDMVVRYGSLPEFVRHHSHDPESIILVSKSKLLTDDLRQERVKPIEPTRRMTVKKYVYLMLNKRNGLYKIGISSSPKVREGTLQSEEPEVSLIGYFPGTLQDEESLHLKFKTLRVRGEWFRLYEEHVMSITTLEGFTFSEKEVTP